MINFVQLPIGWWKLRSVFDIPDIPMVTVIRPSRFTVVAKFYFFFKRYVKILNIIFIIITCTWNSDWWYFFKFIDDSTMIIAMTKYYSTLYHATSRWDISNDFRRSLKYSIKAITVYVGFTPVILCSPCFFCIWLQKIFLLVESLLFQINLPSIYHFIDKNNK